MKKSLALSLLFLILTGACAFAQPVTRLFATATPTPPPTATLTPLPPTPTALLLPTSVSAAREPEPTREGPTPTPAPESSFFDEYLPGHKLAAETEHFTFHTNGDGYLPVDLERWKVQAEVIYAYVAGRVQATSTEKVAVGFLPPQTQECPIRGLAAQGNPPQILIYADEKSPEPYLFAVLAHELGHAIPSEGFEGGLPNDLSLTEGLASWAAGKYWLEWKQVASLDELVRGYIAEGVYVPMTEAVTLPQVYPWQKGAGKDCLARRDQIYTQWAAFIDYLVERFGWDTVHQLFESAHSVTEDNRNIDFPTNYPAVTGYALNQLEADWLNLRLRPSQ